MDAVNQERVVDQLRVGLVNHRHLGGGILRQKDEIAEQRFQLNVDAENNVPVVQLLGDRQDGVGVVIEVDVENFCRHFGGDVERIRFERVTDAFGQIGDRRNSDIFVRPAEERRNVVAADVAVELARQVVDVQEKLRKVIFCFDFGGDFQNFPPNFFVSVPPRRDEHQLFKKEPRSEEKEFQMTKKLPRVNGVMDSALLAAQAARVQFPPLEKQCAIFK